MRSRRLDDANTAVELPTRPRTSPAALRISLAGQDDEPPAKLAERLIEVLGELRQSDLSSNERYDTLRHCLELASRLRAGLTRQLVGLSLPPPQEQIVLSRRCAEAYRLMSDCFRSIAEDISRRDAGSLADAHRF
ncbi:MAG TPA: hypothetical protein VK973_03115, partial [Arenicellales bacterium]|nr:hypothetical protein [Arenicellales bacterium]